MLKLGTFRENFVVWHTTKHLFCFPSRPNLCIDGLDPIILLGFHITLSVHNDDFICRSPTFRQA